MIAGASNGQVVLSVRDLSARRQHTRVLENLSFDVVDRIRDGRTTGQIVSLLGRSGVGKSTLLRIIAGLERPTHGEVLGPNGKRLDAHKVGVVFQDYPLLAHRTVLDNLVLAGKVGGLDRERARARAMELLSRIGLEKRATYWPGQLSGGQRQRVAIAQQIMLPRRLLLLDEPFSGLDPVAAADVIDLIADVANDHELNTILIVTHDLHAAIRASDTVLLLGTAANESGGARVAATFDLVELGVAWNAGSPERVAGVQRDIEQTFRSL